MITGPVAKIIGGVAVAVGLVLQVILLLAVPAPESPPTQFGVSFSPAHAAGIGLDWHAAYQAILHELQVKRLRLGAYWNEIEPADDQFDFTALDYQMDEAAKAGASVMLTVGRKVQRWPECHEPPWLADATEPVKQDQLLEIMKVVVQRYRGHAALALWQLENEPWLEFGLCPPLDVDFFRREEALLRSLDPSHPIVITDSGELNWWLVASRSGDILGTTMYRTVFSSRLDGLFSYDYIFPAWLYRLKSRYIGVLRGKDVIVSELQGEPWGAKPFPLLTASERQASISPARLVELHRFAQRTQLPIAYWWGVEYWYWEKEINDDPRFWQTAQSFF